MGPNNQVGVAVSVHVPYATGVFDEPDPATASIAMMGALVQVGMFQVVTTGAIDAEATAATLVPQMIRGIKAV